MLTERNRAVLHRRLTEVVGDEEAVSEMLSNVSNDPNRVPAREGFVESFIEKRLAQQTTVIITWMIGTAIALVAIMVTAMGILR